MARTAPTARDVSLPDGGGQVHVAVAVKVHVHVNAHVNVNVNAHVADL